MHGFEGMGIGMGFSWIIGIVVLIIITWAITKGYNINNKPTPTEKKTALEILKERYAQGEINKVEFAVGRRIWVGFRSRPSTFSVEQQRSGYELIGRKTERRRCSKKIHYYRGE